MSWKQKYYCFGCEFTQAQQAHRNAGVKEGNTWVYNGR